MKRTAIHPLTVFLIMVFSAMLAQAEIMCVRTSQANVREGPGGKYDVLWVEWQYAPFQILGQKGRWYLVMDFEGYEGYLHSSVLSDTVGVIVDVEEAFVRTGPGEDYKAKWVLEQGYPLLVLERKNDWLKVTDSEEVTGWINKDNVWGLEIDSSPGD